MATIVCQKGSHQDSTLIVEPRTTSLRLKLSPQQKCQNDDVSAPAKGGWSFLQSLSNASPNHETTSVYVHPLCKRASATILSEKSLALCTENLGNETGTTDILTDFSGAVSGDRKIRRRSVVRSPERSFPPPLTTMSSDERLCMKPRRENGRLIMEVVKAPARLSSCFRADRSDGRLRLFVVESPAENSNVGDEAEAEAEEAVAERERFENDVVVKEETQKVGAEHNEEEQGMGESEKEKFERGRIEKFGRVRVGRCKEGDQYNMVENKSMLKPFWVAT